MNYIYVDNFGLLQEARRVSSVSKGLARNIREALDLQVVDPHYTIDFGKLHLLIKRRGHPIGKTTLFGAVPSSEDSIWEVSKKAGFEVIQIGDWEDGQKIDAEINTAMLKDAYQKLDPDKDTLTLVAGEGDFRSALVQLRKDGFCVEVIFWDHLSTVLKNNSTRSIYLNPYLPYLEMNQTDQTSSV